MDQVLLPNAPCRRYRSDDRLEKLFEANAIRRRPYPEMHSRSPSNSKNKSEENLPFSSLVKCDIVLLLFVTAGVTGGK